ncbi:ArnT family glycosyltransferase [Rhodocyclus gracilis]|uniref:Glycosyl transferase family 39 n=1 Tax=Rhodocyclus tenuis TaxID=1066 RepID=A0A6L5JU70_RHOTE|nr:glycosyltransferase family 39 protein [Rhodocyclus gracilis]MQY50601.1 glycosyl transferase family 39 [Rhodocyclus gracilis]
MNARWANAWRGGTLGVALVLALLVFRFWFSAVLPMTGDEAYFVLWGEHPAGGYYDHPPMVGWWLTALLQASRAEWFLRLPAVLLPGALALVAWQLARPLGSERARLAAMLVLLQPASVWNVLITTDTPVILFSVLAVGAYVAALRARNLPRALLWQGVAGLLLGGAFLGKYFAALLGVGILAHVLLARRDRGRWAGFAVLVLAALPAPIYNLWWNNGHCWVNVLFNFVNRTADAGFQAENPPLYFVCLAYLATPWLLIALWRQRAALRAAAQRADVGAVLWLAGVPLLLLFLLSFEKSVGLHWLASFTPLLAAIGAMALPLANVARLLRCSALFAVAHVLLIGVISTLPLETWRNSSAYDGIVLTVRADELLARLQPWADDYLFATDGYSPAATLAYHARRPFAVFGEGSYHARQDDFLTDWRVHDGGRVLILRKSEPAADEYAPYFERIALQHIDLHGVRYTLVLGEGFRYAAYRDGVLTRVRDRFYRAPAWMPRRADSPCEFCTRYFPDDTGGMLPLKPR